METILKNALLLKKHLRQRVEKGILKMVKLNTKGGKTGGYQRSK